LHNKLFGLLAISHYSKVNCYFLKVGRSALLSVFMMSKEKNPEFRPPPCTQRPGRNIYRGQDPTATVILHDVVLEVSPSVLQPLDPALQATTSPAPAQALLGGQEQGHTARHPWGQGKAPFPALLTVVFGHTNDSCALQPPVLTCSKGGPGGSLKALGCLR